MEVASRQNFVGLVTYFLKVKKILNIAKNSPISVQIKVSLFNSISVKTSSQMRQSNLSLKPLEVNWKNHLNFKELLGKPGISKLAIQPGYKTCYVFFVDVQRKNLEV